MKKTLIIFLLAGCTLSACNSNNNSENTQDTADTSAGMQSDMQTDTTGMDSMDTGTMNQNGDTSNTNRSDSAGTQRRP
jgi:hypothetical protein